MIPPKFKSYCQSIGIILLPEDLRYLTEALRLIPFCDHRSVLKRYSDEWLHGQQDCEDNCKAVNVGRRRANIWLRKRGEE